MIKLVCFHSTHISCKEGGIAGTYTHQEDDKLIIVHGQTFRSWQWLLGPEVAWVWSSSFPWLSLILSSLTLFLKPQGWPRGLASMKILKYTRLAPVCPSCIIFPQVVPPLFSFSSGEQTLQFLSFPCHKHFTKKHKTKNSPNIWGFRQSLIISFILRYK